MIHRTEIDEGWRPIETAPRDGTRFLAAGISTRGEADVGVAYYLNNAHTARPWAGFRFEGGGNRPAMHPPTHWRPLPTPPQQGEG